MARKARTKKAPVAATTVTEIQPGNGDAGQSPPLETSSTIPTVIEVPEVYVDIHKEVQPQLEHIKEGFTIITPEWAAWSDQCWKFLDTRVKEAEKKFKVLTKPFNEGLKGLRDQYNTVTEPWETAKSTLKDALLAWKKQQDAMNDQALREADERRKVEVATISQTTGIPPAQVEQNLPQTPVVTVAPIATPTRRVPKWKVVGQVPFMHMGKALWILDDGVINELRRAAGTDLGRAPDGIEFYYDETLVNRSAGQHSNFE